MLTVEMWQKQGYVFTNNCKLVSVNPSFQFVGYHSALSITCIHKTKQPWLLAVNCGL